MEQRVIFNCHDLKIEGRWAVAAKTSAAVITHPHPLYGGDMDNAVVETITKAYRNNGWSTLRFNFRGTGNSQGRFDDGTGEQKDVAAAIAFLKGEGMDAIELAGYSFGAWVLALTSRRQVGDPYPMRFVAPPVGFLDFNPAGPLPALEQVIVGTRDEFAPLRQCTALSAQWNPKARLNVVERADHFFWNQMATLQKFLEADIPLKKAKVSL